MLRYSEVVNVFAAAAEAQRTGRSAALVTVIDVGGSTPRSASSRMLVHADGELVGTIGGGAIEHHAIQQALEALEMGVPRRIQAHLTRDLGMCCGGSMEVYIEPLAPREPFVLFGAGHVAHALAPMLRALDFDVTVVDDRDEWCTAERFAGCTLHRGDPVAFAEQLEGGALAYWMITTHDHALDQRLVEVLLPRRFAWLGLIGSRGKVARFLVRLRAAGMDEALFRRLSAPVGLDLGAETPAEIAVSICSELVRVRRRHTAAPAPLSQSPLPARGGDGTAIAPRLETSD